MSISRLLTGFLPFLTIPGCETEREKREQMETNLAPILTVVSEAPFLTNVYFVGIGPDGEIDRVGMNTFDPVDKTGDSFLLYLRSGQLQKIEQILDRGVLSTILDKPQERRSVEIQEVHQQTARWAVGKWDNIKELLTGFKGQPDKIKNVEQSLRCFGIKEEWEMAALLSTRNIPTEEDTEYMGELTLGWLNDEHYARQQANLIAHGGREGENYCSAYDFVTIVLSDEESETCFEGKAMFNVPSAVLGALTCFDAAGFLNMRRVKTQPYKHCPNIAEPLQEMQENPAPPPEKPVNPTQFL